MLVLVFSLLILLDTICGDYLTKKPYFIMPCQISDPYLNQCYAKNLQAFFHEWSSVDALRFGPIDPLRIKHLEVDKNLGAAFNIHANWDNVEILGVTTAILSDFFLYKDSFRMKGKIFVPRLYIQGDYAVIGNVLSWYLNTNGKAYFDSDNVTFSFVINTEVSTNPDGFTFTKVESVSVQISSIGDLHILIKDLFRRNAQLQKSANIHLNRNWYTVFSLFRPEMERIATQVLTQRFKSMYEYVPADFFIENMPKEKEVYSAWSKRTQPCENKRQGGRDQDHTDQEFEQLLSRFLSK